MPPGSVDKGLDQAGALPRRTAGHGSHPPPDRLGPLTSGRVYRRPGESVAARAGSDSAKRNSAASRLNGRVRTALRHSPSKSAASARGATGGARGSGRGWSYATATRTSPSSAISVRNPRMSCAIWSGSAVEVVAQRPAQPRPPRAATRCGPTPPGPRRRAPGHLSRSGVQDHDLVVDGGAQEVLGVDDDGSPFDGHESSRSRRRVATMVPRSMVITWSASRIVER
jgi:hypothetical protein